MPTLNLKISVGIAIFGIVSLSQFVLQNISCDELIKIRWESFFYFLLQKFFSIFNKCQKQIKIIGIMSGNKMRASVCIQILIICILLMQRMIQERMLPKSQRSTSATPPQIRPAMAIPLLRPTRLAFACAMAENAMARTAQIPPSTQDALSAMATMPKIIPATPIPFPGSTC